MSIARHRHLIGVGGAGMSALARLLLDRGELLSGCDLEESPTTRDLAQQGLRFTRGHSPEHVMDAACVVYSSAVPEEVPELVEARRRGIPTAKHAVALGALMREKSGIAVAGTHGKTTTSGMIAHILVRAALDPAYHVGGELVDHGTSARWGSGRWMVAEADEFDRRFLELPAQVVVVTNVESDHLEYYGTFDRLVEAFGQFLDQVPDDGYIVAWAHDSALAALLPHRKARVIRYGLRSHGTRRRAPDAIAAPEPGRTGPADATRGLGVFRPTRSARLDWWAEDLRLQPDGTRFVACCRQSNERADAFLPIPGVHNVGNAVAAMAAAAIAGVDLRRSARALATFHGAARRFQLVGRLRGARVYVDYGHHPTEVMATLAAARQVHTGRIWLVFQPHLYVRTDVLFDAFTTAFGGADRALITDVYSPSGRERVAGRRGSRELVAAMRHPNARYVPEVRDALRMLLEEVRSGDLVLIMGAGPIYRLAHDLVSELVGGATS